MIFDQIGSG